MSDVAARVPESTPDYSAVQRTLLDRRRRLRRLPVAAMGPRVVTLLSEVDAALDRLESGGFGVCTRCEGHMSPERLVADPLATVCLECLDDGERHALERDLEMASRVQAALLPPRDLEGAGWRGHYAYRPYGPVSGDYVDALPVGDDLLVLVGDVAGKGLAAAMLMSQLHAMFRALASPGSDLGEMLRRVNALLSAATAANAYATLAAVRLQPDGGVELCTAGHTPPVLLTASGAEAQPPDGVPLGMFPDSRYQSRTVRLQPREGLLLFTDGLSESHGTDERELGVEGVLDLVGDAGAWSPADLVRRCEAAVDEHRRGQRVHDDLVVLAMRREPG